MSELLSCLKLFQKGSQRLNFLLILDILKASHIIGVFLKICFVSTPLSFAPQLLDDYTDVIETMRYCHTA